MKKLTALFIVLVGISTMSIAQPQLYFGQTAQAYLVGGEAVLK